MPTPETHPSPSRDDRVAGVAGVVAGLFSLARATDPATERRLRIVHLVGGATSVVAGAATYRGRNAARITMTGALVALATTAVAKVADLGGGD